MRKLNRQIKSLHKITAFLLVLTMTAGSLLSVALADNPVLINDTALADNAVHGTSGDIIHEDIIHDGELSGYFELIEHEFQNLNILTHQNQHISQARLNYLLLLEGNYWSIELKDRFIELFGYMSPDYILHNYTTIFDITSEEMDQAVLRVLTQGAVGTAYPWIRGDAGQFSEQMLMEQMYSDWNLHERNMHERNPEEELFWRMHEPELLESIQAPIPKPILILDEHHELYLSNIPYDNLAPGLWLERDYSADLNLELVNDITLFESEYLLYGEMQGIAPLSTSDVRITVVSRTERTVTLDLFFNNPTHHPINNSLIYYDYTIPNPGFSGDWVFVFGQPYGRPPVQTSRQTITGLTPGATYHFLARVWDSSRSVWIDHEVIVTLPGARTPSFNIVNPPGQNSFTFNVIFPVEGNFGNRVEFRDGMEWIDATGMGRNATSGTFTVRNLNPGRTYPVFFTYFNRHNETEGSRINTHATLLLPAEQHQRFTQSNMTFYLDQAIVSAWGPARTNSFVNAVNQSYGIMHDLVGGARPHNGAPIEFRTVRNLPWSWEALAGPGPLIRWQMSNPSPELTLFFAIDHAHAMNRLNTNTTETPFHEVAHHFDNSRWSFCTEAMADLMTHYYYSITGQRMAVANQSQVFIGGAGHKAYMRSYANRILGHINHDAALEQNVYSPYSMAWNLANIQTQIGWEPFRQTFRHFHTMVPAQVPASNIAKLNYFLSRLQDYSGRNVFAMFNAQERAIYQAHFGGTMQYVARSVPPATLEVTPDSWTPGSAADSTPLAITTNRPIGDVTIANDHSSWLTLTGSGSMRILNVTANTSTVQRNGSIYVTVGGLTQRVVVEQAGIVAATLTLSPPVTSLNVPNIGIPSGAGDAGVVGTFTTITTNQPNWTASITPASAAAWLSVTSSGSSGGRLTFSALPNFEVSTRNATVTIRAGTGTNVATHTISVVQTSATMTMNYQIMVNSADGGIARLATARSIMDDINAGFRNVLGVNLVRNPAGEIVTASLNQRPGCTKPYYEACYAADCGPLPVDNSACSNHHHRSALHFRDVNSSATTNTFRFVGFEICNFNTVYGHRRILGLAEQQGRDMILSVTPQNWNSLRSVTAHEISHLLGARDAECAPGQLCVMSNLDIHYRWCDICSDRIFNLR